jgi:methyl-accepting chemotaxis protein
MKLNEVYRDSPYEIRLKAPVLRVILWIMVCIAVPATLPGAILNGQWISTLMMVGMTSLLGLALFQLQGGRFQLAANIFLYTTTVLTIFIPLLDLLRPGGNLAQNEAVAEHEMAQYASLFLMTILFFMLFAKNKKQLLIISIVLGIVYAIYVSGVALQGKVTELTTTYPQQFATSSVVFVFAAVLAFQVRRIADKSLQDAIEKMKESNLQSKHLAELAEEAREKLALAQSMEEEATESAASAVEINQNIAEMTKGIGSLQEKYDQTMDSLTTIKETMENLNVVANDQSANITETGSALEQMVASIKSVATITEQRGESVRQLQRSASAGEDTISETTNSFNEVLQNLSSVTEMISLIKSIASQTNLLAMNAAIEAAHAGELGKGFAVVADEVRKLAETSSKSASDVDTTLKELIKSIEQTGQRMDQTGKSFNTIGQEVQEVGKAIDEITNTVKELSIGSDEILQATSSMTDLTAKVNLAVSEVNTQERKSEDNITALGDVIHLISTAIEEISQGTQHVQSASLQLREKTNQVNDFVQGFQERIEHWREE